MNVVSTIPDGEHDWEAIPVRAFPFVSSPLTPDRIACGLASDLPEPFWPEGDRPLLQGMRAYYLEDGRPVEMPPNSWVRFARALEATQGEWPPGDPDYRDGIKLLPAGVFVWKVDFEIVFQGVVPAPPGASENPPVRVACYEPPIPGDMRAIVMEGFEREGGQEDKGAKYIHDGLSLEYRAAHRALGETLSIAEIASLTADPENMAKRMIAAWLAYVRRTEPLSECDNDPEPPASVELGLNAEIHDGRMPQVFMESPSPADSAALYEFAHHAGHGQYLMVQRDDMRAFLEEIGERPVPPAYPLSGWWPEVRAPADAAESPSAPGAGEIEDQAARTARLGRAKSQPAPTAPCPAARQDRLGDALDRLLLRTYLALRDGGMPRPFASSVWRALQRTRQGRNHHPAAGQQGSKEEGRCLHWLDPDTRDTATLGYHRFETRLGPIRKVVG